MDNNEKILHIINHRNQIQIAADDYLEQLQKRYEWSQAARSQFYKSRREINEIKHELIIAGRRVNRENERYFQYINRVKNEATRLNEKYQDIYAKPEDLLSELSSINSIIGKNYIEDATAYLQRNLAKLGVKRLQELLETLQAIGIPRAEMGENLAQNANYLDAIIGSEMRGYKQFFDQDNITTFENDITMVIENLNSLGLDDYSAMLNSAKNSLLISQEPPRPISKNIMNLLDELSSSSTYLDTGYTAPDFAKPVYDSVNYLKRALREGREFKGTESAIERFNSSVDLLELYYHTYYWQGGGQPRNYHGHSAK